MRLERETLTRVLATVAIAVTIAGCGGVEPAARAASALKAGMNAHAADDLDGAARGYREVLHVEPRNVYAYYNLALVFEEQGDPSRAEYYYRIALGLDPAYVGALMNLAHLQAEVGQTDDAIAINERVATLFPTWAPPFMRLAGLYEAAGRTDDAAGARTKALELDSTITEETANLGFGPADTGSAAMATPAP